MVLTKEQSQTRFLAIILPTLTLMTHTLLALSFALPGTSQYRAFPSLFYNLLAAFASTLGLIGAIKLIPCFLRTYTTTHTLTLSFVTLALGNILIPFDAGFLNPVIPSWHVDEGAICRDIDAGFGWDEEWVVKCSSHFYTVMTVVAWSGLLLMFAQWWALWTVRRWGKELRFEKLRAQMDGEKHGVFDAGNEFRRDEKAQV